MKCWKYIIALAFIGSAAEAKEITSSIPVPFYNIALAKGDRIKAYYQLNSSLRVICKNAKEGASASMQWNYEGVTYKKLLPSTIKDNDRNVGEWAESTGHLIIKNEYGPDEAHVSCIYKNKD